MVEITWLGHGTFQLRLSTGEVFLMDPWTEGNPAYPAEHKIERVDAICPLLQGPRASGAFLMRNG